MNDKTSAVEWKISCTPTRVVVWIKSERIEGIFKRLSAGRVAPALGISAQRFVDENPAVAYLLKHKVWDSGVLASPSDKWAWSPLTRPIMNFGFNFKFLSVVGLSGGLEFPIDLPMSRTMLKEFGKAIGECCYDLIVEYGKAPQLSGSINESELPVAPPLRQGAEGARYDVVVAGSERASR